MVFKDRMGAEILRKPASEFTKNPKNWRVHPENQRIMIRDILSSVGWAGVIVVNETTGHVIDGHARIEEALKNDDEEVPYVTITVTQEEEELLLATLDPIGELAGVDMEVLVSLQATIETESEALRDLVGRGDFEPLNPASDVVDDFKELKNDPDTQFRCPNCGHEWKGSPKP